MVVQDQAEMGEGSANPTDPHHTPTFIQPSTSQPQKKQKPRKPKRKDTQVPQPSGPTDNVANEAVYKELDDSLVRVATTTSSFEAEQDSGNINKTRSKATLNEPSSLGTTSGGGPRRQETIGDAIAQTRFKNVSTQSYVYCSQEMFDVDTLNDEEMNVAEQNVVEEVATTTTATDNVDEVTLPQTLMEIKSTKPKVKGIVIQEPSTTTTTISSQQSQEKGLQERERAEKELEANIALTEEWDDIQAKIEADHELAQRLKAKEQEEKAAQRLEEQILEDVDRAFNRVNTFVDFRTDIVEELQSLMEVIPNEEEVAIDAIPLATKSPSIVNWKIHKEGKKIYYQIIRADGKSQMYRFFSQILKSFSREDLEDLYKLVKVKYKSTRLVEDLDLVLWNDLKAMFEPNVEDEVWKLQQSLLDAVGTTVVQVEVSDAQEL
ncbi:hypothetical protein Tco_1258792 [Tanacetum coccineum]